MARRYRLTDLGLERFGAAEGAEVEGDGPYNYAALVEAGLLEEIASKVSCPACSADKSIKKADVPNFQKQETLDEHYRLEHPALQAPDFEEVV